MGNPSEMASPSIAITSNRRRVYNIGATQWAGNHPNCLFFDMKLFYSGQVILLLQLERTD